MTPFTRDTYRQFRKDFLLLMKNAEVVKDWRDAREFQRLLRKFNLYLENVVYKGILPALKEKNGENWMADQIRKTVWALIIEMRVELENPRGELNRKYRPWITEEYAFDLYAGKRDKWVARARHKAREAWKAFDEYFERVETRVEFE